MRVSQLRIAVAPPPRRHALAIRLLRGAIGDDLPLRVVFSDGRAVDFGPAPIVTIRLSHKRLERWLLTGNFARLGDAYADGTLAVDGRLQDILRVGIALTERIARIMPRFPLAQWLARLLSRHSRAGDAAAIRHHYDVSNAFYALWLDRHMVYSCAYFHNGAEDLDTAQEHKLDHVCRKLRLAPGERLLDIGCGWGGLVRWAARHYGVDAVGVTLSPSQADEARARVARDGLADRVEIRLQDYRDIPGQAGFDKIASIGMVEHVGLVNLPVYFGTISRLLRPGGLLLNHGIATADPAGRGRPIAGGDFMERHVFPGGELAHLSRIACEMANQQLELLDVESLRPHYARTLLHWVRRLEARRDAAIACAGERRYRIWRLYMAGCAYGFDQGWITVYQVLAEKPGPSGAGTRPWTRAHQYRSDQAPIRIGPLDWGEL